MRYLKLSLVIAFIVLLVWYFNAHTQEFKRLLDINYISLLGVLVLQLSIVGINALFLKMVLRFLGKHISTKESFTVTGYSSAANFFGFFQAGAGVRALYLKRKFGVTYKEFTITFLGNYLIIFLITAIIGAIALSAKVIFGQEVNIALLIIFIFTSLGLIVAMRLRPLKYKGSFRLVRALDNVLSGWKSVMSDGKLMLILALLSFGQFFLSSLLYWLELWIVGTAVSFSSILLFTSIVMFAVLAGFTPGGIGLREGMLIFASDSLGISTSAILGSSVIDRGVYFFMLLGLFLVTRYSGPALYLAQKRATKEKVGQRHG